jgi:hypothetical protein
MADEAKLWNGLAAAVGKAGARPSDATAKSVRVVAGRFRSPFAEINITAWESIRGIGYLVQPRFTIVFALSEAVFALVVLSLLVLTGSQVLRALVEGFWVAATAVTWVFAVRQRNRMSRAVGEWVVEGSGLADLKT